MKMNGRCHCGAVAFEVDPPVRLMVHCHCSRCRRSSGAAHATNILVEPIQLRWIAGEAHIVRFDLPEAKSFGKWFCRHCGCPVPRITRDGCRAIVPAGSLDGEPPLQAYGHIFWASRARWGCMHGGLPVHAELPPSVRQLAVVDRADAVEGCAAEDAADLAGCRRPERTTSFALLWSFTARMGRETECFAAYGPDGAWAELFRRADGFIDVQVLRDNADPRRFLTLDRWQNEAARERFLVEHLADYEILDRKCETLTESECFLGAFSEVRGLRT